MARTAASLGEETRITAELLRGVEAVIEFALPSNVLDRVHSYASAGVPAVIGTTGYSSPAALRPPNSAAGVIRFTATTF